MEDQLESMSYEENDNGPGPKLSIDSITLTESQGMPGFMGRKSSLSGVTLISKPGEKLKPSYYKPYKIEIGDKKTDLIIPWAIEKTNEGRYKVHLHVKKFIPIESTYYKRYCDFIDIKELNSDETLCLYEHNNESELDEKTLYKSSRYKTYCEEEKSKFKIHLKWSGGNSKRDEGKTIEKLTQIAKFHHQRKFHFTLLDIQC